MSSLESRRYEEWVYCSKARQTFLVLHGPGDCRSLHLQSISINTELASSKSQTLQRKKELSAWTGKVSAKLSSNLRGAFLYRLRQ